MNSDFSEQLKDALEDLSEDVELIRLTLLGAQGAADKMTLRCLLRLSDYLEQHMQDIKMLMEVQSEKPC